MARNLTEGEPTDPAEQGPLKSTNTGDVTKLPTPASPAGRPLRPVCKVPGPGKVTACQPDGPCASCGFLAKVIETHTHVHVRYGGNPGRSREETFHFEPVKYYLCGFLGNFRKTLKP